MGLALAAPQVGGCMGAASGESTSGDGSGRGPGTAPGSGSGNPGSGGSASPGGTGGAPSLPPEREVESTFEVPVATGRYVWIANPLSGRVAYVDAVTLAVKTAEAGNGPTYLAQIPGAADAVIVLNVLSHDATVLRAENGRVSSVMVRDLAPLANAWAVSRDGRFALAWTDARRALAELNRKNSLEGFQALTVIDLAATPPTSTTVAVGYRPVSITFSTDSRLAFVVTEDGVSVVELGEAGKVKVLRDVPVTADPTERADTRDVTVTADGRAIVRREGSATVRFVNLATGGTDTLALSAPVTDLDVTPDGQRAVAVVRGTSEVAVIPIPPVAGGATIDGSAVSRISLPGELIGSVALSADGSRAVLYSNAVESGRIVVLDLAAGTSQVARVHAPVLSAILAPDGRHAVILHQLAPQTGADGGVPPDGGATPDGGSSATPPTPALANAFSVVPLDGSRSGRIQETAAPPRSVAFAPASDRALVTVRDDRAAVYGVYVVGMPELDIDRLSLASPPISTGVVAAANRGYVAQSHPDGRITFVSFAGGQAQTITGFDLGSRVVDGVNR